MNANKRLICYISEPTADVFQLIVRDLSNSNIVVSIGDGDKSAKYEQVKNRYRANVPKHICLLIVRITIIRSNIKITSKIIFPNMCLFAHLIFFKSVFGDDFIGVDGMHNENVLC